MSIGSAIADLAGTGLSAGLSAQAAAKNRKFQKKMFKHRYQYTVKDMRKAGINPIAAASQGLGGGSSPGGAVAQVPDFGRAATTAISSAKNVSEIGKRSQETRNLRKQNQLLDTQILGERARVGETNAKTQNLMAQTLLAINAKERWQPFADAGHAVGGITGPARNIVDDIRQTWSDYTRPTKSQAKKWLSTKGKN